MEDPIANNLKHSTVESGSDEELVARAVSLQDGNAFGELVRRHQSRVRGCLRQLTRDFALADDLAQETFVRAWDKLSSFSGQGRFVSWLMKLAYNEFLQSRRKAKRYSAAVDRFGTEQTAVHNQAGSAGVAFSSDLEVVLAALSEEERSVMVMSFALGLSHAEIGDVTGMPIGTVKSHIHRARQRIREKFPEESGGK